MNMIKSVLILFVFTHIRVAYYAIDLDVILQSMNTDIMQRSIMGNILPDAMVCYLESYGAEKFAEIFLGEFDTPEAIWSAEMRKVVFKIACTLLLVVENRLIFLI